MTKETLFTENNKEAKTVELKNADVVTMFSLDAVHSQRKPNREYNLNAEGNVVVDSRIPEEVVKQILESRDTSNFLADDADVRGHLCGDVVTFYYSRSLKRTVGFDSINFKSPKAAFDGIPGVTHPFTDEGGVYFAGALIDGQMQDSGLYTRATKERVRRATDSGLKLVFTETQNPRIEAGIKATLKEMVQGGEIQSYIMVDKVKFPGLYGRCMYKEIPTHPEISYDELDYQKGDAYGLVFKLVYSRGI